MRAFAGDGRRKAVACRVSGDHHAKTRLDIGLPPLAFAMQNPHAERQAVLLERIVKNAVRRPTCSQLSQALNYTRFSVQMHRNADGTESLLGCAHWIITYNDSK
jgi:hypothetical protein